MLSMCSVTFSWMDRLNGTSEGGELIVATKGDGCIPKPLISGLRVLSVCFPLGFTKKSMTRSDCTRYVEIFLLRSTRPASQSTDLQPSKRVVRQFSRIDLIQSKDECLLLQEPVPKDSVSMSCIVCLIQHSTRHQVAVFVASGGRADRF
jgi:hypothetical protein